MLKVAILDDYQHVAESVADWSGLSGRVAVTSFQAHLDDLDAAAEALADFDIVVTMRERQDFPRALFARLPRLKLLVLTGPFAANLDFAAARDHGVMVCGTTGYGPLDMYSTPELTWALVLATARWVPQEHEAVRAGGWQHRFGILLRGKTMGIVGLGRIGGAVAGYANAFGMRVLAWSPNMTDERARAGGAKFVEKDALFAESDVVSVNLMLSGRTRGIIGAREIGLMKRSAIFINTARSRLVDEAALVTALRERRIAGAGLDVFDTEPLPRDHELRRMDNVVLSPHVGYVTPEQYASFYAGVVEDIVAWLDGKPINVLNAA